MVIELAREMLEAFAEAGLGNSAGDYNPVGSRVALFAHRKSLGEISYQDSIVE